MRLKRAFLFGAVFFLLAPTNPTSILTNFLSFSLAFPLLACEELCGPYVWGRYDVLLMPPSFPYGEVSLLLSEELIFAWCVLNLLFVFL